MKKYLVPALFLTVLGLSSCGAPYTYSDADKYTAYTEKLEYESTDDISSLYVSWISGEVTISEGDHFSIYEEVKHGIALPLYYRLNEECLMVRYCESGKIIPTGHQKKLIITVPSHLDKLEMDLTSGTYTANVGDVDELDVDVTSGTLNLKARACLNVDVDHTSSTSNIEVNSASSVKIDHTSGENNIKADAIDDIFIKSTSGLTTLETTTFKRLTLNSTSGGGNITVRDSSLIETADFHVTSGSVTFNYDGVRGYNLTQKGKTSTMEGSDPSKSKFTINASATSGSFLTNIIK